MIDIWNECIKPAITIKGIKQWIAFLFFVIDFLGFVSIFAFLISLKYGYVIAGIGLLGIFK